VNAKKAKALRRKAREATKRLPEVETVDFKISKPDQNKVVKTTRLANCTKGAYRALKAGKVVRVDEASINDKINTV
jgi:hypothetical protein